MAAHREAYALLSATCKETAELSHAGKHLAGADCDPSSSGRGASARRPSPGRLWILGFGGEPTGGRELDFKRQY